MLLLLGLLACPKPLPPGGIPENGPPAMRPVYVPDPAVDARVSARVDELSALYQTGRYAQARTLIERILAEEPENAWSSTLRDWQKDLSVLGQPAPPLGVNEWVQGGPPPPQGTTLLVFFEAWCPHCQTEMPVLAQRSRDLQSAGLTVVGLTQQSRGVTDDELRSLLLASNAEFAIGREDGTTSSAYGVVGIPSMAVIRDGVLMFRGHPSLLSDEALRRWLTSPTGEP